MSNVEMRPRFSFRASTTQQLDAALSISVFQLSAVHISRFASSSPAGGRAIRISVSGFGISRFAIRISVTV
jgi:hypothetical protein